MAKKFASIDDYLAAQPLPVQPVDRKSVV